MTFRQWLDQFGCAEWIATEVCVPEVYYEDKGYMYIAKLRSETPIKYTDKITGLNKEIPAFPKWPIWVEVKPDASKVSGRTKKALKVSKKVYYGCLEIYNSNQPLKHTKWNFERN